MHSIEYPASSNIFCYCYTAVSDWLLALAGSTHVNAYLHGFSSSTSIVLYERLLTRRRREGMGSIYTADEVLAVLSHEIGHWSLSHIPKLFVFNQVCRHLELPSSSGVFRKGGLCEGPLPLWPDRRDFLKTNFHA